MSMSAWLGGDDNTVSPEPGADPLAPFEIDVARPALPVSRIVDPADPSIHLTDEQAHEMVALLDTVKDRMTYCARVKDMADAGLCQGCVKGLSDLLGRGRECWGQN